MKRTVTSVLVTALMASVGNVDADVRVRLHGGAVVADGSAASAPDVVAALVRATGMRLRGVPRSTRTLALPISAPSIEALLQRVLDADSFTVRYDTAGTPVAVELLGAPSTDAPRSAAAPVVDVAIDRAAAADPATLAHPIRVGRRLAFTLGTQRPAFGDVMSAMVDGPDAAVRGEAFVAMAESLNDVPVFAQTFVGMLRTLDDDAVAAKLRDIAGDGAQAIARRVAGRSDMELVRNRFAAVADRLGTQAPVVDTATDEGPAEDAAPPPDDAS